ncbi:hypothetical protein OG252_33185 [Streptomyces sp. NBC_01352]|uniref:hypothetical protein n=1 Tax=Streptomyces sp. NBC_01352 TaxID=2903834 RepID=UPI002E308390|nr:hypothetical protein [Streptomyces sp. NBC_01352]
MTGKPITSAQRIAARALGVDLPPVEQDPHTQAAQALETADSKAPAGWSTGDAEDVITASRSAVQVRRGQHEAA